MIKLKFIVAVLGLGCGLFLLQGCSPKNPDSSAASGASDAAGPGRHRGIKPTSEPTRANPGAKIRSSGGFRGFVVYADAKSPDNHFAPTGWMGDYQDLKFDDKCAVGPHGGATCIETVYTNKATQGARWSGIYWQNPPNNWGIRPGGYNLSGAKKVTFWAKGKNGGERIEEFKIGGITGEYADSDVAGIGPVVLTPEWKQFTIDLEGKDLSSISGGFAWSTNLDANPSGCTFYLDDIKYE